MPSLDGEVAAWMRRHRSTVSNEHLEAIGISEAQRRRPRQRRCDRACRRPAPTGSPASRPDDLMRCAALCTSRPELVVAGPTAGRYWKFPRVPRDELIHVTRAAAQPTVPRALGAALPNATDRSGRRRRSHRRRQDHDGVTDRRRSHAIRSTMSRSRRPDRIRPQQGCLHVESLQRCAERLNTPGRPLGASVPPRPREPPSRSGHANHRWERPRPHRTGGTRHHGYREPGLADDPRSRAPPDSTSRSRRSRW